MKRIINFIFTIIFISSVHANEKAIIKGLSYMALLPQDIRIDLDAFKCDSFSMKLCDYILENPEKSEFEMEEIIKYIKYLSISKTFEYAEKMDASKKENKKIEWKNISLTQSNVNMNFLIDSLITDGDYYEEVENFLRIVEKRKNNEEDYMNILKSVDYLLSLSENGMKSFIEDMQKMNRGNVEVIIGTENDDTHYVSKGNKIIIDFRGNDIYIALDNYSLACGIDGISGVIDFHGNDAYIGKSFDIGCGINGVGFIDDREGNDSYNSQYCSIGAGFLGMGFIIDREGNDSYLGSGNCEGFGFTKGIGFIYDIYGDDSYIVRGGIEDNREEGYHSHLSQGFGFGIRDIASGGVGILFDNAGDDIYLGEYFTQGSSYWHSLGILYDNAGNDIYKSRRYSQGAGTHFTVGLLMDRDGDDIYHSWGVSQGCGHDFSFGMLTDYKGDDIYYSNWLSQGAGNANGTGVLIDFEGNDSYKTMKRDCQGWGNSLRKTFSYGMLFDMSGKDAFNEINQKTEVKTKMGVLIDKN
ncbi:MAG: hypothetical protein COX48_00675 [bacterium (Candidatus Stahlbacteria) CG23_combo_of_CG06-09_8_20_14_all_34_7]|nr:MAG: hypothetical protein COX48_00675 [bacterium (Candidatus Stahlbacteria) CG23_combo_of_CG06-09_8_20_14_all_34_7]